jgi:subtilisin-like proprotein convertase family protein
MFSRRWLWVVSGAFVLAVITFFAARRHKSGSEISSARTPSLASQRGSTEPAEQQTPRTLQASAESKSKMASVEAVKAFRAARDKKPNRFEHRLSNTTASVDELARRENSIVLANALLDTAKPISLNIPEHLRSNGDPGSYIVQSKGPVDARFREALAASGAAIISYIPNNAFLVRASKEAAEQLAAMPTTQTVLPYEPYYKLQTDLLNLAVDKKRLTPDSEVNVLLFADSRDSTIDELKKLGVEITGEQRSPFGPVVKVKPPIDALPALAQMTGVQGLEPVRKRVPANDLSRVRLGVAVDTQVATNFLNLDGSGVMVNVNDTGVDATHPDLTPDRVFGDFPTSLVDSNGHGTHVAGTIAGSGEHYQEITNASGSVMPPTNGQFRGIAPKAKLFAMNAGASSDTHLQETAAHTNAFISENGWNMSGAADYDLAAASYDAAVRDALPREPGSHPMLYVFAAGNQGGGSDDGASASPDTIASPGTAKNVLTVGAIEQARNITNMTHITKPFDTGTNGTIMITVTNQPWLGRTDSSNQVAGFSSRGNVGVGVEGLVGRAKPDVVAPGTFVVSTTEKDHWDQGSYYNPTNFDFNSNGDTVQPNQLDPFLTFVPYNAVRLIIRVSAPVDLPIYVRQADVPTTNTYDVLGTNIVSLPPDHSLTPTETFWFYSIGNPYSNAVPFTVTAITVTTNDQGDYFEVYSNLNNTLGPFYRYETGTSMSSANVAGMLALMQQYYEQTLHLTNSPALMKALVINGARSVNGIYDLGVGSSVNHQGWGLANLPTSLLATNPNPTAPAPAFFVEQSLTNALATGDQRTYNLFVDPAAIDSTLRITLAWTDPAGNPVAGVKVVNDLDVVVTNLATETVYYGNDFAPGADFNTPRETNDVPVFDFVNNVENVYIPRVLGTNYSVTVKAHRVNVNARTDNTNNVVQDYVLVVSCGEGDVTNAVRIDPTISFTSIGSPDFTVVTNSFVGDAENTGSSIGNQRAGANPALSGTNTMPLPEFSGQLTIGITNQWHFYVVTNENNFTNAAFLTFLPPTLSIPRMGVHVSDQNNASRAESDVDLYVSTDPNLTNLYPSVLAAAAKSLGRGGTETVVLSNASAGLYYIGVKSESAESAEYNFLAVFSISPFGSSDTNGNLTLRGFPNYVAIPDGTPDHPGVSPPIKAIAARSIPVKRVIVMDSLAHENMGDLLGVFDHNLISVALNNHSGTSGLVTNVYNDSEHSDIPNPPFPASIPQRHTDGPGSLTNFMAHEGIGQWTLVQRDNALGSLGTNNTLTVWLERQQDLQNGVTINLKPGECDTEFMLVPPEATNLTIVGTITSGTGPALMEVCPADATGPADCQLALLGIAPFTNSVVIDKSSDPPLNGGVYTVRVCNNGSANVQVYIRAFLKLDLNGVTPNNFAVNQPVPILDDAVTYSSINILSTQKIVKAEVGVRIDHPRVSDLVLHLISPDGTRMLLQENRGGDTTNGLGSNLFATNVIPVDSNGDFNAQTNIIQIGAIPSTLSVSWDFFQVPDFMHIYYNGSLLFDSGLVSGTGTYTTNLSGPGTQVVIVMNEGGNTNNTTTAWRYTASAVQKQFVYFTYTEDTNKTITPVKFAIPPFLQGAGTGVIVFSNSFELPGSVAATYNAPTNFDVWTVVTNQVRVIARPGRAHDGDQVLQLRHGGITTVLPTQSGATYLASLWVHLDITATNGTGYMSVAGGGSVNFTGDTNWVQTTLLFTANGSGTVLTIQGVDDGLLVDTVTLNEIGGPYYVLPEDPFGLSSLPGKRAGGTWQLEIWDNRVGAYDSNAPPQLLGWETSFILATPRAAPAALVDNTPTTNTLGAGRWLYYVINVPYWASFATNTLLFASPPPGLNVWFNQTVPPTGLLPGDVNLLGGPSTGGLATLQTNGTPPLIPGRTYYLGVQNPNAVTATFSLRVNFDVTPLTNGIPVASLEASNSVPRYFSYDVTTNETAITVLLTNLDGDVNLVASKTPFPNTTVFDYGSFNPGSNNEEIIIFTNSEPAQLTPGRWYFGVFGNPTNNVNYTIVVIDYTNALPNIVLLNNMVPYTNSILTGDTNYYRFIVHNTSVRAQFEIDGASGPLAMYVRRGLPLPDAGLFDFTSGPTNSDQKIKVFNFSAPPLGPGDWFITVPNSSGAFVNYSIMASEWPVYGTNIVITNVFNSGTNSFCLTWTSLPAVRYWVGGRTNLLDSGWSNVSGTITATNYSTTWCLPLPSPYNFFRVIEQ